MRTPWNRIALATGLLAVLAGQAGAAGLQLRVGREPYYEGVPIDLHVHAAGFEKQPDPTCEADPPPEGELVLRGLAPNISSSIQVINGRVLREEKVTFTCQFQFVASRPGSFTVGPFRMAQGADVRQTEQVTLRVDPVPVDDRVRLRVLVPEEPVVIGQHVPIEVEWWIDEALRDRIAGYTIRSRLFEQDDAFRFIDDPPSQRGQQSLSITTPEGEIELGASLGQRRVDGRNYLIVSTRRTLVPLRSGEFDLGSARVQVDEVVDWQRDLFGRRTARSTRKLLGRDTPRRLVVQSPPLEGRPPSYAGAVGRGFSLEVTADRSVVQLGDPITLELTLRGDGNLESAGPPPLTGEGGLAPARFRIPPGDVSGQRDGDVKTFRIGVRVIDDAVREVPSLAYSWFDPDTLTYETTQSRPIALSVRPAEVITAGDVVSAVPGGGTPEVDEADRDTEDGAPVRRGSIRMTGADLSVVTDPERLQPAGAGAPLRRAALYGTGFALMALAAWRVRQTDVSPETAARRASLQRQRSRIASARSLPGREALSEVVHALRELAADAPEVRSAELDALVRDCETLLYDPNAGDAATLDDERRARAEAILDAAREVIG